MILHEGNGAQRRDWLAEGCGLKERFARDRTFCVAVTNAIRAGPRDATVLDDGDAHAGYGVVRHPLDNRRTLARLTFRHGPREQAAFHARDPCGLRVLGPSDSASRREKDEQQADDLV